MFRVLIQLLLILACWGGLALIGIQTWRIPTTTTSENRILATKPAPPTEWRNTGSYIRQLETWWSDSIHYRQVFLRISTEIHMYVGLNPQGEVLIGKDGWYFWTGERTIDAARNNNPLTPEEVMHWRNYLLFRHLDAQKHGAKFLFVVIPNKETAYAEYLPDNITQLGKQSWLDQIAAAVQQDGVHILDMRPTLAEGKKHAQLYTKTDTHWNLMGANYGQYDIARTLKPDFPLLEPYLYPSDNFYLADWAAFNGTDIIYYSGLPYMLGISENELEPLFKEPQKKCAKTADILLPVWWQNMPEPQRSNTFHATSCDKGHYRAVFFRDSFVQLLEPYLSEIFQYAAYAWVTRPNDMGTWTYFLESAHPDIMVDEMVERYLVLIPRRGLDYPEDFNPARP